MTRPCSGCFEDFLLNLVSLDVLLYFNWEHAILLIIWNLRICLNYICYMYSLLGMYQPLMLFGQVFSPFKMDIIVSEFGPHFDGLYMIWSLGVNTWFSSVDTSYWYFGFCLHVSTLDFQVSILHTGMWSLVSCVDACISQIKFLISVFICWHLIFKCRHFYPDMYSRLLRLTFSLLWPRLVNPRAFDFSTGVHVGHSL